MSENGSILCCNQTNITGAVPLLNERIVTLVLASVTICLSIASILFNGVVVIVFLAKKRVRTSFNYFLFNLTVIDLILGIIAMPFNAAYSIAGDWPFSYSFCTFFWYVDFICMSGTLNAVTLISLDRFFCVFTPIQYRRYMSKRLVISVIVIQWVYLHALIVPYVTIDRLSSTLPDNLCFIDASKQQVLGLIVQLIAFCSPLVVTTVSYLLICIKINLRRSRKVRQQHSNFQSTVVTGDQTGTINTEGDAVEDLKAPSTRKKVRDGGKERNLYMTLSWLTLCVIVCWTPGNTYFTLAIFTDQYTNFFAFSVVVCLEFVTCVINPIVYHHSVPDMRTAVSEFLRCR